MPSETVQLKDPWKILVDAAKVLGMAGLLFGLFFIAEHNPKMSTVENFVLDIEVQEGWAQGGNSLRRIGFVGCGLLGVVGLMFGKWHQFRWNLPMVLFLVYLVWTGASAAWSIDAGTTVRRYVLMMCCVVGCVGLSRFLTLEQVLLATIVTILGWLVVGVAAELVLSAFRPHKGDYRFAGTIHPNLQAANLAMLCIAAFAMTRVRPTLDWLFYGVMAIAFAFLVLTKCRTVVAVLPFSLLGAWWTTQPAKKIAISAMVGVWVAMACGLGFLVSGFDPIAEYSELLLLGRGEETGSSLTGRLPLWYDLSAYIANRPWQGHGFGAFWTPRNIYDVAVGQQWTISEAHSSYVDTALQTGMIGVSLMLAIGISTFFHAVSIYRQKKQPEYLFIIAGVIFCMVRSLTESGLSGPTGFTCSLFLAMASHSWGGGAKRTKADTALLSLDDQPESAVLESGLNE